MRQLLGAAACAVALAVAPAGIAANAAAVPAPSAFAPYQPLAAGSRWDYVCSNGIAAARTIAPGSINGLQGFVNTVTFTIPGAPQVQYGELQTNDAQGTKIGGFTFPPTYPSVPIGPLQVEFPLDPVIGQTVSFADGFGGTIAVTYQGFATVTVPAGTFNAGVFSEVDSGRAPLPFPRTLYMVRGIGEVQAQLAGIPTQSLPALTCQLVSFSVSAR